MPPPGRTREHRRGRGRGGQNFCFLYGNAVPFDEQTLRALYPTHDSFVVRFTAAVDRLLLPEIEDPAVLPREPFITAITLAELSVGPLVATTDEERAARQAHLQQAEADFDPLPFDAPAARVFGRVAASLRRSGRRPAARSYDAMIAAIALANDLPLFTCNAGDFSGIEGLEVVPVKVEGGR